MDKLTQLNPANVVHYSKSYAGHEVPDLYYSDIQKALANANRQSGIVVVDDLSIPFFDIDPQSNNRRAEEYFPNTHLRFAHFGHVINVDFGAIGYLLSPQNADIALRVTFSNNNNPISLSLTDAECISSNNLTARFTNEQVPDLGIWEEWIQGCYEFVGGAVSTTGGARAILYRLADAVIMNGDTGTFVHLKNLSFSFGIDGISLGGGQYSHKRYAQLSGALYAPDGTPITSSGDAFGEAGASTIPPLVSKPLEV